MKARHVEPERGRRWGNLGGHPGLTMITELLADRFDPPVEAVERPGGLEVRFELAGVKPEDIDICFAGRTLIVSGERKTDSDPDASFPNEIPAGTFERRFELPNGVNDTGEQITFENGILTVALSKQA